MKKNSIRNKFLTAALLLAFGGFQVASAAIISASLGNTASGFADGSIQPVFLVGGAQGGQPAPFDTGYGTDGLFGGDFMQSWTFNYGAIVDTIIGASLSIGIYDHDSAASGSQLALYDIDGNDLTSSLDALFEAPGNGLDGMYNIYSLVLSGGQLAALADGSATVTLNLQGPGLVPVLIPFGSANPPQETATNGANLIFSTLTIETRDAPVVIPEPGSFLLFGLGLLGLGLYRRKQHG